MTILEEMLPELTEQQYKNARHESSIEWIEDFMARCRIGDVHFCGDLGVILQKVNPYTIRCVRVYDDPEALWLVKMYIVACRETIVNFEFENAIITPITDEERRAIVKARAAWTVEANRVHGPEGPDPIEVV